MHIFTQSHSPGQKSKMIFVAITVFSLAIILCPSTCLELPDVQTVVELSPPIDQFSVNTAYTKKSITSKIHVPTTEKGTQNISKSKLQSPSKSELSGETNVTKVRIADKTAESLTQFTDEESTSRSDWSYPQTGQLASLAVTAVRQAGGHKSLPTPTQTTTIKLSSSVPQLQREMEPNDTLPRPPAEQVSPPNGHCPPVRNVSNKAMAGAIVRKFHSDSCAQEYTWILDIPEGYGFVVEFNYVEMLAENSLTIFCPAEILCRSFRQDGGRLAPLLSDGTVIKIVFCNRKSRETSNFNISYTAHPKNSLPRLKYLVDEDTLTESYFTYDCTGITDLPKAITCDGIRHCQQGEDEKNCSYRTEGCGDWFPYGHQCLKAIFGVFKGYSIGQTHVTMPVQAEQSCQSEYGATLASLPDLVGINIVTEMIRKSGFLNAVVGIHKVKPVSRRLRHLYRYLWQWGDRGSLMAYEQHELQRSGTMVDCAVLDASLNPLLQPIPCTVLRKAPHGYVCMKPNPNHSAEKVKLSGVSFPRASAPIHGFSTKDCRDGSVVQTFHRCPSGPQDEDSNSGWSPNNFPLFQCRLGSPIHYSLLCDGNDDCADKSDEQGCQKPQFSPLLDSSFICRNFQAIPTEKKCNGINDCFDESDEEACSSCSGGYFMCAGVGCVRYSYANYFNVCPQISSTRKSGKPYARTVILDGYGMSILTYVDGESVGECEDSFFACRESCCIPTFLLNNGEKDCRYGEDEDIPVHNMTCPGYYRCQKSGSCVHKNYVCDGIYHCPNKDDERFCHMTCPRDQGCICEGYAYKCSEMIDPQQNLHVRYLDLSHASNVSLESILFMEYLFLLNLSFCNLSHVAVRNMPHLEILDLRHNSLTKLAFFFLHKLPRLMYLDLSHNPIARTLNNAFTTMLRYGELQNLRTLIMSNVGLEVIEDQVFSPLSKLRYLDIRANPVHIYNKNSLLGLTALEELHTDESKLCCSYFHPSLSQCHAPVDELSSCSDLLAQDFFRVFLWTFSVLAIVGNAGVLTYRLFVNTSTSHPAFRILVKNLCASDLLMGVYMMMIGVGDAYYRGVYVAKEGEWTNSTACTIAGFLCFVSSEVSAIVVCLITLDRVLVLCFPLNSRLYLSSRVIVSACCAVWVIGIVLAAVPLLAGMEFYGLNGICLPLPITRRQFSGQTYAFGVFIVLNFVLFVFIIAGQVCIYHAVRNASTAAGSRRHQQDMVIARRLFLVVFTDFCCWFPIGLMGLLAASGTPISGKVNVWAAIFVLPVNSALNPFLYTLNGLMEQRKKRRMEQRTKRLIGKLHAEIPKWQSANVEELMGICIHSKLVEREIILRLLGINVDSATAMTSNKDPPSQPEAVYDRKEFASTAYDGQDVTYSTNIEVHDEVENRITEAVTDCREFSSTAYDSQDATHSTNMQVCDEVEDNLNRPFDMGK